MQVVSRTVDPTPEKVAAESYNQLIQKYDSRPARRSIRSQFDFDPLHREMASQQG